MTATLTLAAVWLGLALVATLLSIWLRIATALSEIGVGIVAQLLIGALEGPRTHPAAAHAHLRAAYPVLLHSRRARAELEGVRCVLRILEGAGEDAQKEEYVRALGAATVIALGNGNNDRKVLRTARVGIAVCLGGGVLGRDLQRGGHPRHLGGGCPRAAASSRSAQGPPCDSERGP